MNQVEWQASYDAQRPFADRFNNTLIQILVDILHVEEDIRISTEEEDIRDGVDVVIAEDFHVGLRVRKFKQLQYADQFTVRNKKNRFKKTELDKIKEGKLHGLLYAFADEDASRDGSTSTGLHCWKLLRMKALRLALEGDPRFSDVTCQAGHFYKCQFFAYDIKSFPPKSLVIAESNSAGTITACDVG